MVTHALAKLGSTANKNLCTHEKPSYNSDDTEWHLGDDLSTEN